ncbi:MAG: MBL fold metallo-hydrolase, partial [Desulfatiglandales bacterium]
MESKIIPIPLSDPQFRDFFCSYLIEGKKICLVDVGPYNGHAELIKRLEKLNVERIDYILLTHIHIDHAGALQPLLDAYPMARGVCHEMGIKFLANPDSFWDASLKVLKERAIQYGKPAPVSAERLDSHKEASIPGVRILTTPGHAPHHLCFLTDSEIFLGEAGGNH